MRAECTRPRSQKARPAQVIAVRPQNLFARLALASALFASALFASAAVAEPPSPAYVEGYATALLEETHDVAVADLRAEGPLLVVQLEAKPRTPLAKLARALLAIEGVDRVRFLLDGETLYEAPAPNAETAAAEAGPEGDAAKEEAEGLLPRGWEVFPSNELFDPLLADPRWPRFSASYQNYFGSDDLDSGTAVSFGEDFTLIRAPRRDWGEWEIVFQAGVFSVFDLESDSFDLVNSDFLVGLGVSHHIGDLSTLVRFYHQSSHLGDEYLLRSDAVDRVNLSFEVLDALVSYEPLDWLRLYGGGGVIVHREPAIDRGITQTGLELQSPVAFVGGYLRPLAAVDLQFREQSDWKTDLSVRGGLQIEHPVLEERRLQILVEYYDGRSPNGQFYDNRLQVVGVGVFLGF